MSRCFPYPPPGYSRNGATYEALIESIKLQKGTDKAKAERKKEKRARKEKKKEKKKRKEEEKVKSQKIPNECLIDAAHKVLHDSVDCKEVHAKGREPSTERLEKSDLTEEHGQPLGSHKPSYSSDSTQNSNKRKRDDDATLPGGATGSGKPIKIRLLKKHQGTDSSKETLCFNSGRTDPTGLCGADTRVNTLKISASGSTVASVPISSVGKTEGVLLSQEKPTTSLGRPRMKNDDTQGLHFSRNQPAASSGRPVVPPSHLNYEMPAANSQKTELPLPSGSRKSNVHGLHSSRIQLTPSSGTPILPPPSGSKKSNVQGLHLEHELPSLNPNLTKPSDPLTTNMATEKRPVNEIPVPTKFEKKMRKKHAKYEKLIGSWVPPVLQAQQTDGDDGEDWLSRSEKTCRSLRDDGERCRESAACSLWRPCAQFLPETDIYALPYTVPF